MFMNSELNRNESTTWNISKDPNVTRSACRTSVEVAFLTSYIVTEIAIFIGNLFTGAVFLSKHQLRRTYMNVFLISLACSDFLMAILVLPGFTVFCSDFSALPFSLSPKSRTCNVLDGLKDFVFLATVFNVLAITFDRYQAVIQSLRYRSRMNKKTVAFILVLVWLVPCPIAYLKHILIFTHPLIIKDGNSSFIYDNVVVFTCIITPMVVLLVVNTMLTRAIREQQAKISNPWPGNLYLTQQQMKERELKNEAAMGDAERTKVQINGVRRDNREDRFKNRVNEGFQGDDEQDKIKHATDESRGDHVVVPSINLVIASISSEDDNNIDKASQINGFQGDSEGEEVELEFEKLDAHVTCNTRNCHETAYANELHRKTLDIVVGCFGDKFSSEVLVDPEANDRNILNGFSHDFEIQQESCVRRDDNCDTRRTRSQAENTKQDEERGTSIIPEALRSAPRRKIGCVTQPLQMLLNERLQKQEPIASQDYSITEINNSIINAENIDSLKQARPTAVSQEQESCAMCNCRNSICAEGLRRVNSLQGTLDRNVGFEDANTTQGQLGANVYREEELQNTSSSSLDNLESHRCLTTRELVKTHASSCNQSGAFPNANEIEFPSEIEDNKISDDIECKQDDEAVTVELVNEEIQRYGETSCCSTTEKQSPNNDRGIRKKLTFQEHKKSTTTSTESSLIRKQMRKFSRDKKERNGTRSCLTVALIFVICWIPRCLYNFLLFSAPDIIDMYLLEKFSMLFLFLQSLTNPLVYCFYRGDFRQTAKELLRKIIRCRRQ